METCCPVFKVPCSCLGCFNRNKSFAVVESWSWYVQSMFIQTFLRAGSKIQTAAPVVRELPFILGLGWFNGVSRLGEHVPSGKLNLQQLCLSIYCAAMEENLWFFPLRHLSVVITLSWILLRAYCIHSKSAEAQKSCTTLSLVGSMLLILMNLLFDAWQVGDLSLFFFCAYNQPYSSRSHCCFGVRFCLEKTCVVSPCFV